MGGSPSPYVLKWELDEACEAASSAWAYSYLRCGVRNVKYARQIPAATSSSAPSRSARAASRRNSASLIELTREKPVKISHLSDTPAPYSGAIAVNVGVGGFDSR